MTESAMTESASPASPFAPGRHRGWLLGAMLFWLVAAVFSARTWEHQHDEGIAFDIAIGALQPFTLEGAVGPEAEFPAPPSSIAELTRQLDGDVGLSFGDVVTALRDPNRMPHPPAFYLALHAWARLVGSGTLALRVPALLLGLLSMLGVYRLARRLIPARGAPEMALVLMAISPWYISLTCFLRPYSLALCASVWALVAVLSMQANAVGRGRAALLFIVTSTVGLLTVYHYSFVFFWHGILLGLLAVTSTPGTRVRRILEAAGLGVLVLAATSPWWPALSEHLATTGESSYYFSMDDPLNGVFMRMYLLFGRFGLGGAFAGPLSPGGTSPRMLVWVLLGLITVVFGVTSFVRRGGVGRDRVAALTWASALLLPLSILAADLSRGTGTIWVAKYGFGMFPMGVLFVIRSWTCLDTRWLRVTGLSLGTGLLVFAMVFMLRDSWSTSNTMERVAQIAAEHDEAGHIVVLSSFNRRFGTPQVLTLRDYGVESVRLLRCDRVRLPYMLKLMSEDPDVTRMTLVQFAATAQVATAEDTEFVDMWPVKVIARLPELALPLGWQVTDIDLQAGTETTRGQGKPLTLVHEVVSKTFHGRN